MRVQEQNRLILMVFESLSSPHEHVRLNAEYAYIMIEGKLREPDCKDLIEERYPALIDLLLVKLKYFYFESKTESVLHIVSSLIEKTPVLFQKSIVNILEFLIRCFDKYYQDEFMWIIEHFLPIFIKVLKYAASTGKNIVQTNLVRQLLMRIRPLLGSHKTSLIVMSYTVLRESLVLLAGVPMEREDPGVFSPEDPENVLIPNSLPAIFFEFWPAVLFQFNSENNLPILNECIKICARVAEFAPNFFETTDRFGTQLWPRIKLILHRRISNQLFLIKTQISALGFLKQIIAQPKYAGNSLSEIIASTFCLLNPKEEDRETVVSAFSNRLIQLRNGAVELLKQIDKISGHWHEQCVAEIRKHGETAVKEWRSTKSERPVATLWELCVSFIGQLNEAIGAISP